MNYGKNLLIATDQWLNALFGGWADETMSSAAFRMHRAGKRSWPMRLINALFWWENQHCYQSYVSELKRAQMPPELRGDTFYNDIAG